jgi:hypothetical protein
MELHEELKDASLEKAAEMAGWLVDEYDPDVAFDLSYMLEYLRLNFRLVPREE